MGLPWWVSYVLSFDFGVRAVLTGVVLTMAATCPLFTGYKFQDRAIYSGLSVIAIGLLICIWTADS